jgi:hypothetical protein
MKPTRRRIDLVLPREMDEMQHVATTALMASVHGTSVCFLSRMKFEIRGVTGYGLRDGRPGLNSRQCKRYTYFSVL